MPGLDPAAAAALGALSDCIGSIRRIRAYDRLRPHVFEEDKDAVERELTRALGKVETLLMPNVRRSGSIRSWRA